MMKRYFLNHKAYLCTGHWAQDSFQQHFTIIQVGCHWLAKYIAYSWNALRVNHLIVFIYYLNYIAESNDLLSLEVLEHSFTKIVLWLHDNWGSYHDECLLTTTTSKSTEPGTTQDVTSIDNGTQNTSNVNYKTAACILLGMHFFTLIIWLHLKV